MAQWLMAKIYDRLIREAEERGLSVWRQTLLQQAQGQVLELGCGTGNNLPYYPTHIQSLILVEPNLYMHATLKQNLSTLSFNQVEIRQDKAESIAVPDKSIDTIVCTLVLCSVKNLDQALAEMYRILKPQGKLIFIEHVAAITNPSRYIWQKRLSWLWKLVADGCDVTRQTEEAIQQAGFKIIEIERQSMRGVPPIVRPSIRGIAIKTS